MVAELLLESPRGSGGLRGSGPPFSGSIGPRVPPPSLPTSLCPLGNFRAPGAQPKSAAVQQPRKARSSRSLEHLSGAVTLARPRQGAGDRRRASISSPSPRPYPAPRFKLERWDSAPRGGSKRAPPCQFMGKAGSGPIVSIYFTRAVMEGQLEGHVSQIRLRRIENDQPWHTGQTAGQMGLFGSGEA